MKKIDRASSILVTGCVVRYQSHTLAAHKVGRVSKKYGYARSHLCVDGNRDQRKDCDQDAVHAVTSVLWC
jgi:hypothetical protein